MPFQLCLVHPSPTPLLIREVSPPLVQWVVRWLTIITKICSLMELGMLYDIFSSGQLRDKKKV